MTPLIAAKTKKIKKIKPGANPPEYVAFSKPLDKQRMPRHALERLTFGPRPGEVETLQRTGLDKFLEAQLNPEKVPENPLLIQRLNVDLLE